MLANDTTLLMHACCAPCTLMPVEALRSQGWRPQLCFDNSNIHPQEEYEHRLETLRSYAQASGLKLHVLSYEPTLWHERVGVLGGPYPLIEGAPSYEEYARLKEQRCTACYRLRFERVASSAASKGIAALSTTLTVSPWQYIERINDELARAAAAHGLTAVGEDWRTLYPKATQRARELGLYRQNYCGCCYSQLEAEAERTARKAQRALRKQQRHKHQEQQQKQLQQPNPQRQGQGHHAHA